MCGIYIYGQFEKRNFLLAVNSRTFSGENELKENQNICFAVPFFSFDYKQGFSYFAVLACQGKRDEAFVRSRETLSELQSVEIDVEISRWLLTELIGVEPRFSGCFHRQ